MDSIRGCGNSVQILKYSRPRRQSLVFRAIDSLADASISQCCAGAAIAGRVRKFSCNKGFSAGFCKRSGWGLKGSPEERRQEEGVKATPGWPGQHCSTFKPHAHGIQPPTAACSPALTWYFSAHCLLPAQVLEIPLDMRRAESCHADTKSYDTVLSMVYPTGRDILK